MKANGYLLISVLLSVAWLWIAASLAIAEHAGTSERLINRVEGLARQDDRLPMGADPDLDVRDGVVELERQVGDATVVDRVEIRTPGRAAIMSLAVTVAVGLVALSIGAFVGLLPRGLMLSIVIPAAVIALLFYLNQRRLIPINLGGAQGATYAVMYGTMQIAALAFLSGLAGTRGMRAFTNKAA